MFYIKYNLCYIIITMNIIEIKKPHCLLGKVSSKYQRIYKRSLKCGNTMGIGIKYPILLLLLILSAIILIPHATCACSGPCVVGGSTSYDFMGDPAVNLDMSSPDEFIRESLGSGKTSLSVKSLLQKIASNNSSSLNQTNTSNISQNSTATLDIIDTTENKTSDNSSSNNTTYNYRIVKLGASSIQDKQLSTLVSSTFNNMF